MDNGQAFRYDVREYIINYAEPKTSTSKNCKLVPHVNFAMGETRAVFIH
jgi:hypothetical protein